MRVGIGAVIAAAAAVLLAGCSSGGAAVETWSEPATEGVLVGAEGVALSAAPIAVIGSAGVLVELPRPGLSLRLEPGKARLELQRLPAGWREVVAHRGSSKELVVLRAGDPGAPVPADPPRSWGGWICGGLAIAAYLAYAILFFGVSGGPNHGEAPFLASLIHLIGFLAVGRGLERPWFWAYVGLLVVALGMGIWAMGIRIWSEPRKTWAGRIAMLLLHAGLAAILYLQPGYRPAIRWVGHDGLLASVRASQRGSLELLDESGAVLHSARLGSRAAPVLLFWPDDATPVAARVVTPSGETVPMTLKRRPSR